MKNILFILFLLLILYGCISSPTRGDWFQKTFYPFRSLTKKEKFTKSITSSMSKYCQKMKIITVESQWGVTSREVKIAVTKKKGNAYAPPEITRYGNKNQKKIIPYKCNFEASLFNAVSSGETMLIHEALEHGANINYQDKNGETILFLAARAHYKSYIGLLINLGVNKAIKNNNGENAKDIALKLGYRKIAKLIKNKIDETPNSKN